MARKHIELFRLAIIQRFPASVSKSIKYGWERGKKDFYFVRFEQKFLFRSDKTWTKLWNFFPNCFAVVGWKLFLQITSKFYAGLARHTLVSSSNLMTFGVIQWLYKVSLRGKHSIDPITVMGCHNTLLVFVKSYRFCDIFFFLETFLLFSYQWVFFLLLLCNYFLCASPLFIFGNIRSRYRNQSLYFSICSGFTVNLAWTSCTLHLWIDCKA